MAMTHEQADALIKKYGPSYKGFAGKWQREKVMRHLTAYSTTKTNNENCADIGIGVPALIQMKRRYRLKNYSKLEPRRQMWRGIVERWDPTKSMPEMAVEFDAPYSTIVAIKNRFKLKCMLHKSARVKRALRADVIRYLRDRGVTFDAISRLFQVSKQRVQQVLKLEYDCEN